VVSPRTGRLDRIKKLPVYAREGVGHLWLIDPLQRTLEVLRLESGRWTIIGTHGDDRIRAEPFEAIELELSALWTDAAAE
jgi:Uma2 family endonuclease